MTNPEMISHQWLQERIQQLIEDNDTELDLEESLILYGLDSLRVMRFAAELKERRCFPNQPSSHNCPSPK